MAEDETFPVPRLSDRSARNPIQDMNFYVRFIPLHVLPERTRPNMKRMRYDEHNFPVSLSTAGPYDGDDASSIRLKPAITLETKV